MAKNGLLLWILGGTGLLLIYAAYKNQTVPTVLKSLMGAPGLATSVTKSGGYANIPPASTAAIPAYYSDFTNGYTTSPKTHIIVSEA